MSPLSGMPLELGVWPCCLPCPTWKPNPHHVGASAYHGSGDDKNPQSLASGEAQADPSMACHCPFPWNNKASAMWTQL